MLPWNYKMLAPWKKTYDKPRKHIKNWRHHFAHRGPYSQSYGFSSSHVCMWELDHKEGQPPKKWCFWILLEKTLEISLDCKEVKPVKLKGNQSWIFIGGTNAEAEIPMLWPPDVKSCLIWNDLDAGKDGGKEGKVGDRGWYGWVALPTQWAWVWVNSGS